MTAYLPDNAPSTTAIDVMEKEFSDDVGDTRIMISDVSIQEALHYKQEIEQVDGVSSVMWLDDVMDLQTPIEMADDETVEAYYKNDNALFTIDVEDGMEIEATEAIYEIIGEDNALTGEAVDTAVAQEATGSETLNAALILIPIIIIILILSTTSWIEPVFFLTAIGVSVLINMGTNIFIGEISFISQAVAPILQLAVAFLPFVCKYYRQRHYNLCLNSLSRLKNAARLPVLFQLSPVYRVNDLITFVQYFVLRL